MRMFGLSLLAVLAAGSVGAFTAVNGVSAYPEVGDARFEVVSEVGSGPRQIWCAAAQYALVALSAPPNTRIYLARAMAPSPRYQGRKSASFTIRPDAALQAGPRPGDGGNYSVSLKNTGYSLRLAHAETFCHPIIEFYPD
ncbi:hypothetical protein [Lentibacter sp. XHP0401]|uniref:hypothetical protein n=1 Tax=Lentibacter sp. XHP0401 TaxID=2984334 RepID=UPI0021E873F4|nr:hypothetical protein [Lentibacter sp. XHP0401]MCV2894395.1 hypothetical protein [Lentibacter sp. XHP0401]